MQCVYCEVDVESSVILALHSSNKSFLLKIFGFFFLKT